MKSTTSRFHRHESAKRRGGGKYADGGFGLLPAARGRRLGTEKNHKTAYPEDAGEERDASRGGSLASRIRERFGSGPSPRPDFDTDRPAVEKSAARQPGETGGFGKKTMEWLGGLFGKRPSASPVSLSGPARNYFDKLEPPRDKPPRVLVNGQSRQPSWLPWQTWQAGSSEKRHAGKPGYNKNGARLSGDSSGYMPGGQNFVWDKQNVDKIRENNDARLRNGATRTTEVAALRNADGKLIDAEGNLLKKGAEPVAGQVESTFIGFSNKNTPEADRALAQSIVNQKNADQDVARGPNGPGSAYGGDAVGVGAYKFAQYEQRRELAKKREAELDEARHQAKLDAIRNGKDPADKSSQADLRGGRSRRPVRKSAKALARASKSRRSKPGGGKGSR